MIVVPPPNTGDLAGAVRRVRLAAIAGAGFAALVGLLLIVPWQPNPAAPGLDASWTWAVSDAFAHKRVFGTQIVFTMGPLGFLFSRTYYPETGKLLWTYWSILATVWSALVWLHLRRCVTSLPAQVVLFVFVTAAASLSVDAFFLTLPVLAVLIGARPPHDPSIRSRADVVVICALLASGSLIKFSFLLAALGAVVLLSVRDVWERRLPRAAAVYVAFFLLLWIGIGQPIGALATFMSASWEIARGYTQAMAVDNLDRGIFWSVAFLVATLVGVATAVAIRRRELAAGAAAVVLVGSWALVAKAAFVRLDLVHEVIAALWSFCVLGITWPWIAKAERNRFVSAIALLSAAVCVRTTGVALRRANMPGLWDTAASIPGHLVRSASIVATTPGALRRANATYASVRVLIRAEHPLPQMRGTVDVYPTELSVVFANDLRYAPRPVPQSYSAYTPALAALNERRLREIGAPDNVLFDIAPIDERLASMEDGLSWVDLWQRYDLVADTAGFLWMRRRLIPFPTAEPRLIRTETIRLGVPFAIPKSGCDAVVVKIDAKPTLLYRLKTMLWKGPLVSIRLTPGNRVRRVLPLLLPAGFMISPMMETRDEFARIMSGRSGSDLDAPRPVEATLVVAAGHPERYFTPNLTARFFAVSPPAGCHDTQ